MRDSNQAARVLKDAIKFDWDAAQAAIRAWEAVETEQAQADKAMARDVRAMIGEAGQ